MIFTKLAFLGYHVVFLSWSMFWSNLASQNYKNTTKYTIVILIHEVVYGNPMMYKKTFIKLFFFIKIYRCTIKIHYNTNTITLWYITVGPQALPTFLKAIAVRKGVYSSLIVHSPKRPRRTQGKLMDAANPPICQHNLPPSNTPVVQTRDLSSDTTCKTLDATNSPKSNCC